MWNPEIRDWFIYLNWLISLYELQLSKIFEMIKSLKLLLSRPDLREPFYVSIWFGQGVIWVGILYSDFYVLCFYVLAGYGSQSGRAVCRCLFIYLFILPLFN